MRISLVELENLKCNLHYPLLGLPRLSFEMWNLAKEKLKEIKMSLEELV